VNCLQQGFWFEAGRVLFGLTIFLVVASVWIGGFAYFYWRAERRRK
jgi:hypothetical protein